MIDENDIKSRMLELQAYLNYPFNDLKKLSYAMRAINISVPGEGDNHKEYANDALATVGDAVLKAVLADYFYNDLKIEFKGEITTRKSYLENNETMYKLMLNEGLTKYIYNDLYFYDNQRARSNERPSFKKDHVQYIEAIVGAVYYDSDYYETRKWIIKELLPLLEKYKTIPEN